MTEERIMYISGLYENLKAARQLEKDIENFYMCTINKITFEGSSSDKVLIYRSDKNEGLFNAIEAAVLITIREQISKYNNEIESL